MKTNPLKIFKTLLCGGALLSLSCSLATPGELPTSVNQASPVEWNSAANSTSIGPRELEDVTRKSVAKDYSEAWQALTTALAQNHASLLDNYFVGYAKDRFTHTIAEQERTGVQTRLIDRGHKVDVLFYSPDGMSILLRDTAKFDMQISEGGKQIAEKPVTLHYLAVLTPTEVRWKVRVLQAVPSD